MRRLTARLFVWGGGGVFVLSLVLTAWRFVIAFGRDLEGPRGPAMAADVALLSVFALHHSVFARAGIKAQVARVVPQPLIRSCYVWVASLLLIGVCLWWQPIGGVLFRLTGVAAVAGAMAQLAGLWLVIRAAGAIRPLELAGIEAPRPQPDELQMTGPYRLVRHPLYLGWMLMVGATGHMTGDRLLFAGVTTIYIAIAIPWEERSLVAEFGDRYTRYQRHVRWRLVPYIY